MYQVLQTDVFSDWLGKLDDPIGRAKIRARLTRFEVGNFGDIEAVGDGVIEAKVKGKGPGYRFYYAQEGTTLIIILYGGDKSSQPVDIAKAKSLWGARRKK